MRNATIRALFLAGLTSMWLGLGSNAAAATPWRNYVGTCLDTLMNYGTDRYGSVHSDMLVAILDVNTLTSPQNPPTLDDTYYDGGNNKRSVGGANFWYDQETIRAMYRLSSMTGDAHYAAGADRVESALQIGVQNRPRRRDDKLAVLPTRAATDANKKRHVPT